MTANNAILEWYIDAGVDEAIADEPVNHFSQKAKKPSAGPASLDMEQQTESPERASMSAPAPMVAAGLSPNLHHAPAAAAEAARAIADACTSMEELEAAIRAFDGCAIKKTASKTVFGDGNKKARVIIIGEAPGAQEDIQGIPFCGPSGQLLDRMLKSIGLDRTSVFISNTVYWRPPGNRQPSPEETAICLPFVEKLIALMNPALLILSGGTATNALLRKDTSISKLRGKFYDYTNPYLTAPISTVLTYHPSYLLRSPAQKRLAWADLLMMKDFLESKPVPLK